MNTQLIPVFAGELSGVPTQLVDARLLHQFLESAQDFSNWIRNRIEDYGFIENVDFLLNKIIEQTKRRGGHNKIDYHLTLDMAKELGMIERNEKGRQIRRYFIEMERQAITQVLSNPEQLPPPKTKKALPGCLTEASQDEIKQLIQSRAATLARERQAGFIIAMWSALSTRFGVKKQPGDKTPAYKYIPEGMRMECLSLIARLSVDNLVTLTTEELDERVKALEGEVLPRQEPQQNSVTITLAPLENRKPRRWLITQSCNEMVVMFSLDDDKEVLTREQFIRELQLDDYIVLKDAELLRKLSA